MQLQYNALTGQAYQGFNQTDLLKVKSQNKFQSDEWLTFLQAKDKNLKVKKGSHGVHCRTFGTDEKTGNKYFKSFVVFNIDQTEPMEAPEQATA